MPRAVASALRQNVREVIVVNNNSTDGTAAIITDLANKHPEVRAENCTTPGAAAARNHGLSVSDGAWIQFLDADDELDANKITRQLNGAYPATEWIIGGYRNHFPDGSVTENIPHEDPWRGLVFRYRIGCTHANLYRREVLESIGGWREALPDNQDTNLHADLLISGAVFHLDPEVRCTYHHSDSTDRVSTGDPVGGNLRKVTLLHRINDHLRSERPEYWSAHSPFFRGALLRTLRVLATHDQGAAAGAEQGMTKRWKQPPAPELISPLLWRCYRTLGFRRTEALRLRLRHFLPAALKNRLK